MVDIWHSLVSSPYMPHGHCYLWEPPLVIAQVVTNLAIGLSYLSISWTLVRLAMRVRDLPFNWVYWGFGLFIISCGFTHLMDVWVIWNPNYWLDAWIRAVTAIASVGTAVLLFPLVPKVAALADTAKLARERGIKLTELNADLRALYERTREAIAEAIPQLVWTATPEGRLDYLNQRWQTYTGSPSPNWADWVHPDDRDRAVSVWNESVRTGTPYEVEYRLRNAKGEYHWFLARGLPLRTDNKVVKWFGTCTDIDEQKRVAAERERLLAAAEEAVRVRNVFLAIAAHELRTPLTPLRLEIELLHRAVREGKNSRLTPERLATRLPILQAQILRLEQLVNNLLDVSRLSTGRFQLDKEPFDLVTLVREVVLRHQRELASAKCELELRLPASLTVDADRLRIDQVITNLLHNAMNYGREKPIAIIVDPQEGFVRLDVVDRGIGIAPEDQQRIFERFERAAAEQHFGGLGLGLWLVREIIVRHNGTVSVTSSLGKGARFTIELPLPVGRESGRPGAADSA